MPADEQLVVFLEALAAALGVASGCVELVFDRGRLVRAHVHKDRRVSRAELGVVRLSSPA